MFPDLPVTEILEPLAQYLAKEDQAIVLAPPGAGKTSLVPLLLLDSDWLGEQKVILLQPRRLAVKSVAIRLAELLGEPVGARVGYRVRFESKVSKATRLEVMTEGLFLRLLTSDPSLEGIGAVIFDECHERHLDTDLSLALLLNGRALFSDLRDHPLKLLMMSATLDGSGLQQMLARACDTQVTVFESAGRSFPIALEYTQANQVRSVTEMLSSIERQLTPLIGKALQQSSGSILVFLPGVGEIKRLQQYLGEYLDDQASTVKIWPLHGNLSLADQRQVVAPPGDGIRHIILATSIAQTSLTIEGVNAVVDSGLIRVPKYDPRNGLTRLVTERISKATATQRAGRAGRLGPGYSYRAWTESQQYQLVEREAPEILNADLSSFLLQILQWGVSDASELHWLDAPPNRALSAAQELLVALGTIAVTDNTVQATKIGKHLVQMPTNPRLARMLLAAFDSKSLQLAAQLAALIDARDPLNDPDRSDIRLRVELFFDKKIRNIKRLHQESQQMVRLAKPFVATNTASLNIEDEYLAGYLLAHAYPDRLAKKTSGIGYTLANGRGVALLEHDPLMRFEWLVVANSGGHSGRSRDKVFLAAPFNPALLAGSLSHLCTVKTVVEWSDSGRFTAQRRTMVGRLVVSEEDLTDIPEHDRLDGLYSYIRTQGIHLFNTNETFRQWQARITLMQSLYPEEDWPRVSDEGLLASLELWLAPAVSQVKKISDLQKLALPELLAALLVWPQPKLLQDRLPEKITVPSGLNVAIDYSHSPPVLAVKLQAMFGLSQSPRLAEGRQPLAIHLLSPARRPLQITQDLAGFWSGSYHEIRKELKGRYPKHPWPEDPANAQASHRTKPRGQKS